MVAGFCPRRAAQRMPGRHAAHASPLGRRRGAGAPCLKEFPNVNLVFFWRVYFSHDQIRQATGSRCENSTNHALPPDFYNKGHEWGPVIVAVHEVSSRKSC